MAVLVSGHRRGGPMYFCHGLAICCCYHGSAGLGTTGQNVRINTFGVFILGAAASCGFVHPTGDPAALATVAR